MNKLVLIHSVGGEGWVCAGEGLGSLSSMHRLWGMRLGAVRIIKGHLGYLGLLLGPATLKCFSCISDILSVGPCVWCMWSHAFTGTASRWTIGEDR